MPVAAPADRRFRRVQVSPGRRGRGWRDRVWWKVGRIALLLALVVVAGYAVVERVLSAESLIVTRISVSGNERMSRGEVQSLLAGLQGGQMLTVDLEAWRERLLASPWVADAALRRVLPGTVHVFISEREPMGIGRIGTSLYLVDRGGEVIDEFGPNYADLDLPIIDGLSAGSPAGGLLIDPARAALAGRLLSALQARRSLAARVSQIDVSDVRDGVIILKDDPALIRVGNDDFVERLQSYVDIASALRERIPQIDYVDLRYDDRLYVRPQGRKRGS